MFPCSGCGLCCQNITNIIELKEFNLGDGVCMHLNLINNYCNIYEDRPEICRIDEMFEIKYKRYFTKEKFYIQNANVCNSMQNEYKIDKAFRIKIGE